jgi:hypothetical protein
MKKQKKLKMTIDRIFYYEIKDKRQKIGIIAVKKTGRIKKTNYTQKEDT